MWQWKYAYRKIALYTGYEKRQKIANHKMLGIVHELYYWRQTTRMRSESCWFLLKLEETPLTRQIHLALINLALLNKNAYQQCVVTHSIFRSRPRLWSGTIEVFVNNTNLTFLAFLYKISIEVSLKNKVASSGIWTHNTDHHWFISLMLIQLS